jgi:hypothetical protein
LEESMDKKTKVILGILIALVVFFACCSVTTLIILGSQPASAVQVKPTQVSFVSTSVPITIPVTIPIAIPTTIVPTLMPTSVPTLVPTPTKIPTVPKAVTISEFVGYSKTSCEGVSIPDGFTRMDCYLVDSSEMVIGMMYYKGSDLAGISTYTPTYASTYAFQEAGTFIGKAAVYGDWNLDDFTDSMSWMSNIQESEIGVTHNFGSIMLKVELTSDGYGVMVLLLRTINPA